MDTALDILFLDSGGFPVGEAETALSELPVPVPPGAAGARVELQAGGFSLVYVTDPRLSGQPVEVIPQNAAAVHDGDLFASPRPRYHFKWQDGDGGALTFGLRVRRLTAEQAAQALLSAAAAHRIETEALRLEAERLRGALADIYNSRAWRAVRVYYGVKDGIKKLLRGFPAVWRLARRAAAAFGVRSRSRPVLSAAERLAEAGALLRREERRLCRLAEASAPPPGLRAAVHLHLFYTDMAGLFAERLARIPVPFDLFVSVPEGREDAAAPFSALKHARRVTVRAVENRGRDVMPMIRVFGERLAEYDVFLHIHAKKSPHDGTLAGWLDHLLDNLLPDEGTVAAILGLFAGHPELGILYPEPPDAFPYWTLTTGSNRDEMVRLFTRLGLEFPEDDPYPDFPAGTMFWARGAALAALLRSRLDGFPEESGQVDGTLAHAVERSLCLIAARAGYQPAQIDAANGLASIGPGLKNLPEYIALRPEDAAQYLKGFKHAAFDLFGTLAVSDFPSERELWARVASLSSLEEFPRWRREAGDAAAETCGAPDIHTVYAELRRVSGLPASECRRLKALEFEELLESCRPRRAVVRLLEGLLERNADVVLAEDTLWPAAYIQRILEKCGVRGDLDIYVSGELGYSKKNGSLYDYLKGRFKGRPFVNAGDDDYRDAHIPNTRRIHALHLLHPDDMAAVIGLTGEEKALYRARMADDPFCLLDILRERAVTAAPAAPGGSAP